VVKQRCTRAYVKLVVFNLGRNPQRGREPFVEVDVLCTELYYICFIRVLDGFLGL